MYADNIFVLLKEKELLQKNKEKSKQHIDKEVKEKVVENKEKNNNQQTTTEEIFL